MRRFFENVLRLLPKKVDEDHDSKEINYHNQVIRERVRKINHFLDTNSFIKKYLELGTEERQTELHQLQVELRRFLFGKKIFTHNDQEMGLLSSQQIVRYPYIFFDNIKYEISTKEDLENLLTIWNKSYAPKLEHEPELKS